MLQQYNGWCEQLCYLFQLTPAVLLPDSQMLCRVFQCYPSSVHTLLILLTGMGRHSIDTPQVFLYQYCRTYSHSVLRIISCE